MVKQFNKKNLEILGVKMPNKSTYLRIASLVADANTDNIKYTKDDVKELLHSEQHPSKKLQKETKAFDKAMRRDA